MKTINAICVTSEYQERKEITYDENTGLIRSIGHERLGQDKVDHYFSDDCLLFAGMGDVHIHAREDVSGQNCYKEDFCSAREALHNGGLAHAGDMPNNPVPPVDDNSYAAKFKLAEKANGELWLYAGIGPDTSPLSYPVPYKVYMGPSIGELYFKDLKTLDETLSRYKGQWVSFHCEDPAILEGHKGEKEHHERRPVEAEVVATKDALYLIERHHLKGKLCHYSTHSGLLLVREARKRGVDVTLEVTPQHLYFDQEHLEGKRPFYQMNPPIRSEEDRLALLSALKNGEIEFLATDHAPHTIEEKMKGISGLAGLDTYGAFVSWLISNGVCPKLIAKVACENPGRFHNQFLGTWKNLGASFREHGLGVGFLKDGHRANFTVLNLKRPLKVTRDFLKTKVGHSPFLDVTFPGQVEALFIGGKKV